MSRATLFRLELNFNFCSESNHISKSEMLTYTVSK